MGFWDRIKVLFGAKVSSALDRAEDPRQVFDFAYAQQQAPDAFPAAPTPFILKDAALAVSPPRSSCCAAGECQLPS